MVGIVVVFVFFISCFRCCSVMNPTSRRSTGGDRKTDFTVDVLQQVLALHPNHALQIDERVTVLHFERVPVRNVTIPNPVLLRLVQLLLDDAFFALIITFRQSAPGRQCILSVRDQETNRSILGIFAVNKGAFTTLRFHRTFLVNGMDKRRYIRTKPIRLKSEKWHHLIITSSRSNTAFLMNCRPTDATHSVRSTVAPSSWYVRLGEEQDRMVISPPQMIGYVGQKNLDGYHWMGEIKEFILTTNRSMLLDKCPRKKLKSTKMKTAHTSWLPRDVFANAEPMRLAPTDDLSKITSQLAKLQITVFQQSVLIQTLMAEVAQLRRDRLSADRCQCLPRCATAPDGHPFPLGSKWSPERCVQCECTLHGTNCTRITCPILSCTNPFRLDDECCAHCPRDCTFINQTYNHGEGVIQECVQCICQNGTMNCKQLDKTHFCPKLNCPQSLRVRPPSQCCEICRKMDMCSLKRNLCDPLATCHSHGLKYNCTCPAGYRGTGKMRRTSTPKHILNRDGCTPICSRGCQNQGKCVQPGTCLCAPGFVGLHCEYDVNECLLGIHKCASNAVCLNLPGTYACICRPGFSRPTQTPFVSRDPTPNSILLSSKTMLHDRLGETCKDLRACGGVREDKSFNCVDDSICVVNEHHAECLSRKLNAVLPHPWSFIPVDYEISPMGESRACTLEHVSNGRLEVVHLPSEHYLINRWSRNHFCPLCQCQNGILWCPNATHLTLEHLGRSISSLTNLPPKEWGGFYPCPHCKSDSTLRFNWTENCCSLCLTSTPNQTRTDPSRGYYHYTWVRNADSLWNICYKNNEMTVCERLLCDTGVTSDTVDGSYCAQFLSKLAILDKSSNALVDCSLSATINDGLICLGCKCENGIFSCRFDLASSDIGEPTSVCNKTMMRVIRQGFIIPVENL